MLCHTVSALTCAGCALGVDGPTPAFSQRDPLAISPALVCGEQRSSTLDIRGQGFTPVPAHVPGAARLLLPTFALERSAQLDGGKASRVSLVYSGDPEQSENVSALHWLTETHMQAMLDDQRVIDGRRGRLPAGIYDARVVNPNGAQAAAEAALTVLDKPSVDAESELLLCASHAEQALTLRGSGFLRSADGLPSLQIEGQDEAWSVAELSDCSALEPSGGEAALCGRAQLTVTSQLPVGTYEATLVNPGPAACHSEDTLRVRVVAGPQFESDPVENLCLRGQTRILVVRGKGFQDRNGTLPSATLGGKSASVVALEDCEPEVGAVRSCKRLQIELPVGEPAAAPGGATLSVTNPAPASCSASASVQLRELLPRDGASVKPCAER